MVPIARRIAAELPVFVPDLPGHGRSEKPERTLDVPGLAQALRAWMDAVGVRQAARLVGAGRVFVVPGAGHALNYSAADELMRLIRPFL